MEVGNRIRRERQRLGISQEELSHRAYVSRPTLSHWETGRTLPDAQSLWFFPRYSERALMSS